MPRIGRREFVLLAVAAPSCVAAATAAPFDTIARFASALSEADDHEAVNCLDRSLPSYGTITGYIAALISQADVLCAIDPIQEKTENGVYTATVDWYMQLTSQAEFGGTERRRRIVKLELREIKKKWKITKLDPVEILEPIKLK